jgi:hypothetical protein
MMVLWFINLLFPTFALKASNDNLFIIKNLKYCIEQYK